MYVYVENTNVSNTVTGTTTSGYVDVVDCVDLRSTFRDVGGFMIKISNTHVSNTMHYKITGYKSHHASCTADVIQSETSINAASSTDLPSDAGAPAGCNKPWARVVVAVKNNSGACTYQIDYHGYRQA
jgi:hypothetical protein